MVRRPVVRWERYAPELRIGLSEFHTYIKLVVSNVFD